MSSYQAVLSKFIVMLMIAAVFFSGIDIRGRNLLSLSENHCPKKMKKDGGVNHFKKMYLRLHGGKGFRTDLLSKRSKTSEREDDAEGRRTKDLVSREQPKHCFSSSSSDDDDDDDGGGGDKCHTPRCDTTTPQSLSEGYFCSDEEEEMRTVREEKIQRLRGKFRNLEGRRSAQLQNYVAQKRAIQIVTKLNLSTEAYLEMGHTYVGMKKGEILRMLNERIVLCANEYHKIRKRMQFVVHLLDTHDFNIDIPAAGDEEPPNPATQMRNGRLKIEA